MGTTTFSGPVVSQNGFVGAFTGGTTSLALTGTLSVDSTSTLTGAVSAPAGVTGDVTGNVTGDVTGNVTGNVTGSITLPTYTVTTANALSPKTAGKLIYVSNGLAGAPCVAVGDGTNWISPAGTAISAT